MYAGWFRGLGFWFGWQGSKKARIQRRGAEIAEKQGFFGASRGLTSRHRARRMDSCSAMAGCARPQIGVAACVAGARRAGRAGGTVGSRFTGSMRGVSKATGGSRFKGSVRKDSKGTVGSGFAEAMRGDSKATGGSRFKGSVRKDSTGAAGSGFADSMRGDGKAAGGSRFKGSIRDGLKGAVGSRFAGSMRGDANATGGSRFQGSVRDGLNRAAGLGEAASGGGGLARTRNPGARAASSRSGLAGTPASKQGFNAEAQRAQRNKDFGASRGLASGHRATRMDFSSAISAPRR